MTIRIRWLILKAFIKIYAMVKIFQSSELCRIARLTAMLETPSFSQKAVVPRETHDYDLIVLRPLSRRKIVVFSAWIEGAKRSKSESCVSRGTTAFCEKEGVSSIAVSRAMRHNSDLQKIFTITQIFINALSTSHRIRIVMIFPTPRVILLAPSSLAIPKLHRF